MDNSAEYQRTLMYVEMKKFNALVYKSFKKCVPVLTHKVLVPTEKECIKGFLEKDKSFQEEMLQAISKVNKLRNSEQMEDLIKPKETP